MMAVAVALMVISGVVLWWAMVASHGHVNDRAFFSAAWLAYAVECLVFGYVVVTAG